jgi:hypothetical protein
MTQINLSNLSAEKSLLEFPCDFPIKVMGKATTDFNSLIIEIIRRHCPDLVESAVTIKTSRHGKYLSLTATIIARSQTQLDDLYIELSRHERVMMVL